MLDLMTVHIGNCSDVCILETLKKVDTMANVVEGKFYSFLLNITRFSELVPNTFGINIILTIRYVQIKSDVEMGGKKQ